MIAHAYGCRCHIAMPDDAAQEKGLMLEALGNCLQQSHRYHHTLCQPRAAAI